MRLAPPSHGKKRFRDVARSCLVNLESGYPSLPSFLCARSSSSGGNINVPVQFFSDCVCIDWQGAGFRKLANQEENAKDALVRFETVRCSADVFDAAKKRVRNASFPIATTAPVKQPKSVHSCTTEKPRPLTTPAWFPESEHTLLAKRVRQRPLPPSMKPTPPTTTTTKPGPTTTTRTRL